MDIKILRIVCSTAHSDFPLRGLFPVWFLLDLLQFRQNLIIQDRFQGSQNVSDHGTIHDSMVVRNGHSTLAGFI